MTIQIPTRRWLVPARLRRAGRELQRTVLDLVCPPVCAGCGLAGLEPLCGRCRRRLERRPRPVCARCGTPVYSAGDRCTSDHRLIRGLALCRAPLRYRGTGGDLVRRAKFQHDRAALRFLAREMAGSLEAWARGPGRRALLVSVPLHRRKLRARGLDQAAALAEAVGDRLGLRFAPGAMVRHRDTLPQGDVRVTSRAGNVFGAFGVARPRRLDGRQVVLVDDVRTSGSTALECARVLRAAGVRSVALLTAAQA